LVLGLLASVTDGPWLACKLICQRVFGTVGDKKAERDLNEKRWALVTDASSPVKESVAYERCE